MEIEDKQTIRFIIEGDLYNDRKHILNAIVIKLCEISKHLDNNFYDEKERYIFNEDVDRLSVMVHLLRRMY